MQRHLIKTLWMYTHLQWGVISLRGLHVHSFLLIICIFHIPNLSEGYNSMFFTLLTQLITVRGPNSLSRPSYPVLNPGILCLPACMMNNHASHYANSDQLSLKERIQYN